LQSQYKDWSKEAAGDELSTFFNISDHVLRLSLLTLVHRALPNPSGSPTTFSSECIRAARATLDLHQDCMAVVEKSNLGLFSTYMHWFVPSPLCFPTSVSLTALRTILFSPFVPFIVVFCQVIETRDRADLARLQAFVTSISRSETTSTSSDPETEAVTKVRKLFQVLFHVAQHYVDAHAASNISVGSEANRTNQAPVQTAASNEIDSYLVTLGFPQNVLADHHQQQQQQQQPPQQNEEAPGVNPMLWMGSGMQLEDWFYSNQQMMEFLEDGALGAP
jgi:hypothetical protein